MLSNYFFYCDSLFLNFFYYFFFLLFFCFILLFISYAISYSNHYTEKLFGYECGFDPFSDTRSLFKVKFFLISILFILFDIEIVILMPWIISFPIQSLFSFFIFYFFIFILLLGFLYEWRKGCLNFDF